MLKRTLILLLCVWVLSIAAASPALALANRVFVSARSGNNANSCDNIATPCQTFAGAVTELNPDGEIIVLDSGGYGPVTITQGVTIEAPAGVTAFVHPASGDAITVNAGSATVTLRGLTLNVGFNNGVTVNSVGTLNVENCFITGFTQQGIQMNSAGRLNVKGTDIKACAVGVALSNTAGVVQASIDHCHLDGNSNGLSIVTRSPGSSTTTATYTTANNNVFGWVCGFPSGGGTNVLNLEFCTASENDFDGLISNSDNAQSVARYSNCVFANNGHVGVVRINSGTLETRGNNTITGNTSGATSGVIGSFSPM
jgi:parallel beta helix pectate lyase-like protein